LSHVSPWMLGFCEDVRFSLRQFRRAPGYAMFTVLVLALGIGTVTAMFTISYGVLLKPLPFRADRQLFEAAERDTKGEEDFNASYAEMIQWQQATKKSADLGFAWDALNILDAPSGAELVSEVAASPNLFSILGVQPMTGRGFSAHEQISDHPDVVVLSYAMWQRGFGGDRNVLGKTVHIGGVQHTIIGIMPKDFEYPVYEDRAEIWVPLERSTLAPTGNDPYGAAFTPLVRLHAGVRPEAVEAEVANVHAQFVKLGERSGTAAGAGDGAADGDCGAVSTGRGKTADLGTVPDGESAVECGRCRGRTGIGGGDSARVQAHSGKLPATRAKHSNELAGVAVSCRANPGHGAGVRCNSCSVGSVERDRRRSAKQRSKACGRSRAEPHAQCAASR
jgi:hypothetical protein